MTQHATSSLRKKLQSLPSNFFSSKNTPLIISFPLSHRSFSEHFLSFFLSFFFNTHKSRLPTWKGVNDTRCKGKFYLTFHLSLTRAIIWSTYDSINSHTKHLSASKVSQNHLQLQLQNEWQTIEQHLSNYLMSNKPKAPAIFLFPPRWTHSHKIRDSIQFL